VNTYKSKRDIIKELQDIGKDILDNKNVKVKMGQGPHTFAKHKILSEYLKRWYPILGSQHDLIYIDGFAGSGIYGDGSLGSPIIAYYLFVTHNKYPNKLSKINAEFLFIEANKDSADTLKFVLAKVDDLLKKKGLKISSNTTYKIYNYKFENKINDIIHNINNREVALFGFIDPYGYTQYDLTTIIELLKYNYSSEILLNFMTGFMNRFMNDESHLDTIKKFLGLNQEEIKDILNAKNPEEKSKKLVKALYIKIYNTFKQSNPNKDIYYQNFTILGNNNNPLYELVHLTKHWKGVEEMKKSMYEASNVAGLKFSDYYYDPEAIPITNFIYPKKSEELDEKAANYIYKILCKGKERVSQKQLELDVITKTPYIWHQNILEILQKEYNVKIVDEKGRETKKAPRKNEKAKESIFILCQTGK